MRHPARAFGIRDQGFGAVVGGVGALGGVKHVEVFDAGAVVDGLPGFGHACLVRAVVHNGHARVNRIDERAGVGEIHAVMVDQIKIDWRDGVVGADERNFLCACQVPKIEKSELAEGDKDSGRAGILAGVVWPLALGGAVRIRRQA